MSNFDVVKAKIREKCEAINLADEIINLAGEKEEKINTEYSGDLGAKGLAEVYLECISLTLIANWMFSQHQGLEGHVNELQSAIKEAMDEVMKSQENPQSDAKL